MPRIAILIIVLVLIIGGLVLLSTLPREQPTHTIQVDVAATCQCALETLLIAVCGAALGGRDPGDRAAGVAPQPAPLRRRRLRRKRRRRDSTGADGAARPIRLGKRPVERPGRRRQQHRGSLRRRACRRRRLRSNIPASRAAIRGPSDGSTLGARPWRCSPWGTADGAFLSSLMRSMDTPLASRWVHMALRDALLAKAHAPANVNPIDWAAERAWLLLRMGEASAARMIVADVDTDRFTPKMVQVGVQSALANADPAALCPLEPGIRQYEPANPPAGRGDVRLPCRRAGERLGADRRCAAARPHRRIDLALAEKIVGAGANTGRATTIEWDPVDSLTAWRFGLSAAAGARSARPPAQPGLASAPRVRSAGAAAVRPPSG